MLEKSLEYWAGLCAMILYLASRPDEGVTIARRILQTGAAALLALALSAPLAPWVRDSETLAAVLIMALGITLLDLLRALSKDASIARAARKVVLRQFGDDGDRK